MKEDKRRVLQTAIVHLLLENSDWARSKLEEEFNELAVERIMEELLLRSAEEGDEIERAINKLVDRILEKET